MNLNDITAKDNLGNIVSGYSVQAGNKMILTIPRDKINKSAEYLYAFENVFSMSVGDEGWYLCSNDFGRFSGFLAYFTDRKDFDEILEINLLNMFGIKTKDNTYLAIVTGMPYIYQLHMSKQGGVYRLGLYYDLINCSIDEDIVIELIQLEKSAGYIDIAKEYRKYQLTCGECVSIKKRMNSTLNYVKDSVEIRIRLGWKPSPPTVLEQTVDNEPEMHVACTFDTVKKIIDELKLQGVDKAEICLIGWNKSGHDGRWPTAFPVEEKLGGEKKLKELIEYAKLNDYKIVCHTNSTDCYNISDDFNNGEITIKNKDGASMTNADPWSGGTMYWLCPTKALEFAKRDFPKIKNLGFEGSHYIDVFSIIKPRQCFDKKHPLSLRKSLDASGKIMKMAKNLFGGFSSEGAFDHCAKHLDYGLYVCWNRPQKFYMDEGVPLWELVYHGIIMSNHGSNTVNSTIKSMDERLQLVESGSRPAFYFYSKFTSNNSDWMGIDDIRADSEDDIKFAVSKIKESFNNYKQLCWLQSEFIDDYIKLNNDDVTEVTYSDGTKIIVNFSNDNYLYNGSTVNAKSYVIKRADEK